jgi:SAM-dependent methyltransferase
MSEAAYIHGTDPQEQERLATLGELTDEAFVRFLEVRPGDAALDVGSGLGNLARRVAGLIPNGEVWGVERSAVQLARAKERAGGNLHFLQGDAHALPFEEGRFDVVYCRYLLEHVAGPAKVLREMRRVLKPGGRALAQENDVLVNTFDPDCPRFDHVWRQFARLQELLGGDARIGKKLYRLFRDAGFADVRLTIQPEVHSAGMATFRVWVENLIQNVRPAEAELVGRGLLTAEELREGLAELRRLKDDETASAFFYWNRAVGVKAV